VEININFIEPKIFAVPPKYPYSARRDT